MFLYILLIIMIYIKLWNSMSENEINNLIQNFIQNNSNWNPQSISNLLMEKVIEKGSEDNISIIVIKL